MVELLWGVGTKSVHLCTVSLKTIISEEMVSASKAVK